MKINKDIRNLLTRQSETHMLDRASCVYKGKKYTFEPFTNEECEELRLTLLKSLDEKSWARDFWDKITG